MDYLRLDPAIDSDPKLEAAGWWATRVYELLLKVSAQRDLRGRFSPELQDQVWLARRWDAPDDIDPCRIIRESIEKLVQLKALSRDEDGSLRIVGWERWYPTPKTGAERTREWRERRDDGDARDVTPSQAVTVTPTPLHPTPLHPADLDPTAAANTSRAGTDEAWQGLQQQREKQGLLREASPPRRWDAFLATASKSFPVDTVPRLLYAHRAFLRDGAFAAKLWPTDVFIKDSVYQRRMPAAHEGSRA